MTMLLTAYCTTLIPATDLLLSTLSCGVKSQISLTYRKPNTIVDFGSNSSTPDTPNIKGQTVKYVQNLETIIDSKLNFDTNCEAV